MFIAVVGALELDLVTAARHDGEEAVLVARYETGSTRRREAVRICGMDCHGMPMSSMVVL